MCSSLGISARPKMALGISSVSLCILQFRAVSSMVLMLLAIEMALTCDFSVIAFCQRSCKIMNAI